jgi:hypothetical protein
MGLSTGKLRRGIVRHARKQHRQLAVGAELGGDATRVSTCCPLRRRRHGVVVRGAMSWPRQDCRDGDNHSQTLNVASLRAAQEQPVGPEACMIGPCHVTSAS